MIIIENGHVDEFDIDDEIDQVDRIQSWDQEYEDETPIQQIVLQTFYLIALEGYWGYSALDLLDDIALYYCFWLTLGFAQLSSFKWI